MKKDIIQDHELFHSEFSLGHKSQTLNSAHCSNEKDDNDKDKEDEDKDEEIVTNNNNDNNKYYQYYYYYYSQVLGTGVGKC